VSSLLDRFQRIIDSGATQTAWLENGIYHCSILAADESYAEGRGRTLLEAVAAAVEAFTGRLAA
jgi:hypothetical protein